MKFRQVHGLAYALLASIALWCQPARAVLIYTGVTCDGQGTAMTSQGGYLSCSGSWVGNNLNQSADIASQIQSDWGLTGLTPTDITGGNSGASGTLSFAAQTGLFVISLKAGDAFSLYEFDGSLVPGGISSITFDTLGVGFFSGPGIIHFGQGLSHADLYSLVSSVPEPGVYVMLLAGVGVVGFVARRRRSQRVENA